jgi:hypothetical protein
VPVPGVTAHGLVSGTLSVGMPPPSSLLRAQASVLHPPAASVVPSHRGAVPVAVRPCGEEDLPDVVRPICPCVRGPLPRRLVRGFDPFLPSRPRPSPRADRGGAPPGPCSDCSTAPCARLQSFAPGQARRCAHHPGRSSRYGGRRMAAVVSPSEPLVGRSLPTPRICSPSESGH